MKNTLDKQCLIKQPAGLGDIILCQKIADTIIKRGYKIIWPVIDQYYDTLTKHMQKEGITYFKEKDDFPLKELYNSPYKVPVTVKETQDLYLPLQMADQSFPGESALKAKFKILALDHNGWQDNFVFNRDVNKEDVLYYKELELSDDEEYILVNNLYGSPPHTVKKDIPLYTTSKIIEIEMMDGYSMFDWSKVIECATEIYCVDTSLFYLIDMLDLKAGKLEAYSKFNPPHFMHTEGLFKASWNYNE
mgnify:CR=1 FL=1